MADPRGRVRVPLGEGRKLSELWRYRTQELEVHAPHGIFSHAVAIATAMPLPLPVLRSQFDSVWWLLEPEQTRRFALVAGRLGKAPTQVAAVRGRCRAWNDVREDFLRLQGGEVTKLGDMRPRAVDVRIIAATNRRLADEIREGRFREVSSTALLSLFSSSRRSATAPVNASVR